MDREKFAGKIRELLPVLYRVSWTQLRQQADMEDAVQETIRRAWEKCAALRQEKYLQTWVVRILLNVCDDQRRRARRCMPAELAAASTEPGYPQDTPLLDALMLLPERYRLPLQLHYVEGYDVKETAAMLRLPVGTVKSRLSRGREKLRDAVKEEVFE
ncbi:MAG: RNA polymerase sigma factor [Clostridia bacterium]|nr:RNA polymerase sigma factor [Clostridia bacterium]